MMDHPTTPGRRSPNRLYRNPEEGKILGVCAGIGDYLGVNPWAVRLVAVIGLFMFTLPTLVAYFLTGWLVDKKPLELYASDDEADFWRSVRTGPHQAVGDIRHRFRDCERRLRALEAYVTSKAFKLSRDIDELGP